MNTAYVMGTKLTEAFSQYGWCTAIRGAESGGRVEGLPAHIFKTDDGDSDLKCPTEVAITDRREHELSKLGFLPLSHYKNTDYAVFFGAQTCQKPKKYNKPEATENAAISARLPYLMATGRIAHYLKVMARDAIGSMKEAEDVQKWLQDWITDYVSADPNPNEEARARYPLREASIEVQADPREAGFVQCSGLAATMVADGGIERRFDDGHQVARPGVTGRISSSRPPPRRVGRLLAARWFCRNIPNDYGSVRSRFIGWCERGTLRFGTPRFRARRRYALVARPSRPATEATIG